ncbi:MAG: response regulator [Acidobacteria bacterium]|nr:response regulator [Acidobacteriota bacterium]
MAVSESQRRRRALIIGGASTATLRQHLAESGYETAAATTDVATLMIANFKPEVVLIVLERGSGAGENEGVALARHMREEPVTHALPLVLVYVEEERVMRSAALNAGVDDCFGIWTPHEQILARLDALFWRIEVGRRAASMTGDRRMEIDNFIVLLDAVREDIRAGVSGTLALIYAIPRGADSTGFDKQARDRTLAEAHGFFKLNLRRIDAVGFYGPTTLLIYLPRLRSREATQVLMKLRGEFLGARTDSDLALGLASFPDESVEVETLIEKAEAAASHARAAAATGRPPAPQAPTAAQTPAAPPTPIAPQTPAAPQATPPAQPTASAPVITPHAPAQAPTPPPAPQPPQPAQPVTPPPPPSPKQPDAYLSALAKRRDSPVVRETKSADRPEPLSAPAVESKAGAVQEVLVARAAAEHAAAAERELRARGAIMPRRLLLTVSDAARMAQLNALIRSAGYEARTAFDGQQALDLLRIERPDLLLLDYELHGIDGVEMLRRLRKQAGGNLTLPVVMLLQPSQEVARREALELGARGIVAMPYDPAELLDSVRRAGSHD